MSKGNNDEWIPHALENAPDISTSSHCLSSHLLRSPNFKLQTLLVKAVGLLSYPVIYSK